ncbi:MAG: VPLPA-CTERM sorting domain-containing protein [Bryobacteraceae bacterium]
MNRNTLALVCLMPVSLMHAGLVGDTVTVETHFPNLATTTESQNFVVADPGVEVSCPAAPCANILVIPGATIDFTSNAILFTLNLQSGLGTVRDPDDFNGYVFLSLDLGSPITGIVFNQTGFTGLDSSDVSFTANSVSINLQDTQTGVSASWSIDLITGSRTSPVPEPSAAMLLGAGLGGLAAVRRFRKPSAPVAAR